MKTRHDGDCRYYCIRICTCGWLHQAILPNHPQHGDEEVWNDLAEQDHAIDYLRRNPPPKRIPPTPEQVEEATRLLEEIFGKVTE